MQIAGGVFMGQAMKLAPPDNQFHQAEIEEAQAVRRKCHEMDINGDSTVRKEELCENISEGKLKSFSDDLRHRFESCRQSLEHCRFVWT